MTTMILPSGFLERNTSANSRADGPEMEWPSSNRSNFLSRSRASASDLLDGQLTSWPALRRTIARSLPRSGSAEIESICSGLRGIPLIIAENGKSHPS